MYISYEMFRLLYKESLKYTDKEMYIRERKDRVYKLENDDAACILNAIYDLAHNRKILGITRIGMSQKYGIPLRTLENWEANSNTSSEYKVLLLYYAIFLEVINKASESATLPIKNVMNYRLKSKGNEDTGNESTGD